MQKSPERRALDFAEDDFNINVVIRHKDATDGDRLEFHLHG